MPIMVTIVLKGTSPEHIFSGSSSVGHDTEYVPKLMDDGRFIAESPHNNRSNNERQNANTLPYVLALSQNKTIVNCPNTITNIKSPHKTLKINVNNLCHCI